MVFGRKHDFSDAHWDFVYSIEYKVVPYSWISWFISPVTAELWRNVVDISLVDEGLEIKL